MAEDGCYKLCEVEKSIAVLQAQLQVQAQLQAQAQAQIQAQLQAQLQAQAQADQVTVTGNNNVQVDNTAIAALVLIVLGFSNGELDGNTLKGYIDELVKK